MGQVVSLVSTGQRSREMVPTVALLRITQETRAAVKQAGDEAERRFLAFAEGSPASEGYSDLLSTMAKVIAALDAITDALQPKEGVRTGFKNEADAYRVVALLKALPGGDTMHYEVIVDDEGEISMKAFRYAGYV